MYCLGDLGVRVWASLGGQAVILAAAQVPYGFSVDCSPAGLVFRAPPGAVVQIHLVVAQLTSRQPT